VFVRLRRTRVVAFVLAVLVALTACTGVKSEDTSYVEGAGTVVKVAAADRKAPVALEGATIDGSTLDVADYRGQVVVLNVWGSWCAPCREETPALIAASKKLAKQDVQFVGINGRESAATANAHVRKEGIPYPSLSDEGGRLQLSLREVIPPRSFPATIVLDEQGRVAVSVLGKVTEKTLTSLVGTVLHESTTPSGAATKATTTTAEATPAA
jgi:thiol-disulfide isomerase/thioredoxin